MLRIEKILAPVDLTGESGATLHWLSALARNFEAFTTVLYVGSPEKEQRDWLNALARTEFGSLPYGVEVMSGDPAAVIVDVARTGNFGLIAMATHVRGPLQRLMLGSVTSRVLDETECPVFTGTHLETAPLVRPARFDTVVCALDLGPKSEQVACWAAGFAAAVDARLFLLHVVPGLDISDEDYFLSNSEAGPAHATYRQLTAMRDKLGFKATVIIVGGDVTTAIARQASQLGADILIAGRGTAAGRLGRLRSQALSIVQGMHCPVITV